jgi:hypothetical protein
LKPLFSSPLLLLFRCGLTLGLEVDDELISICRGEGIAGNGGRGGGSATVRLTITAAETGFCVVVMVVAAAGLVAEECDMVGEATLGNVSFEICMVVLVLPGCAPPLPIGELGSDEGVVLLVPLALFSSVGLS